MTLFKEIKRRVRNVGLALIGKETRWLEKMEPNKIKIGPPVKVETFAAEQFIGPQVDEWVKPEAVMNCYRRGLAAEIGHKLLEEGVLMEEITQRPHDLGLLGYTMRLSLRVVRPEEEAPSQ